ncbi:MAG: recombinase family protein [Desulfitobacteriaceae bacterium]|nr:recombinase family protein [Desulfitobacteriaceae bacterium]MDI6915621.1 recombinase family protein [Desulfitobacteriaceae bacterium]
MKKIRTIEAPIKEPKRLRVCAYARVSTDQAEQKDSFTAQVEHYTNHIKNNPAWNFAGIYADNAESGLEGKIEWWKMSGLRVTNRRASQPLPPIYIIDTRKILGISSLVLDGWVMV